MQRDASRGATILVIDDDKVNRELFERFFVAHGFKVLTAGSGREGLEMLEKHHVDLALLDVLMPKMDGFQVLEEVRKTYSITELPCVMVTGLDSTEDIVRALKLGANDYVTKPIDFRIATARLETQLALKKATDQVNQLNDELEAAQERILKLVGSKPTAETDLIEWTVQLAEDIATAIAVDEIAVWSLDGDHLSELFNKTMISPKIVDLAMILRGNHIERKADTVLPLIGYGEELQGAIVVPGHEKDWAPKARELLEAFTRQLGGALEMRRTRAQLEASNECADDDSLVLEESSSTGRRFQTQYVQVCRLCGACYNESEHVCSECGPGALLHSPWPIPYRLADRYRLVKVLGKGGMGVVFSATDTRLKREVALKVINPEYSRKRSVRARFKQEAQVIASVQNPGVVSVYDFGELDNGAFYIVMERLFGLDVEYLIKKCGPGTPKEVATFLRQGAEALDAAHKAKIIHRDIKPGNFYLVPDGMTFRVKVLDFGLARRTTVQAEITRAGTIVGTPLYMSPEQAMGRELDFRTDIYSFASVAFRALGGKPISHQTSYARILEDIVRNPPPRISKYVPNLPRKVDKAFSWALNKRPKDRPASAVAWTAAFVDLLETVTPQVKGWWRREGLLGVEHPS